MQVNAITPKQLEQRFKESGELDLLDVRTPIEYAEVRVKFARNVPMANVDVQEEIKRREGRDEPLYVICKVGGRSQRVCQAFIAAGYDNVINIDGGTDGCLNTELPLEQGDNVISLERQVRISAGLLVLIGLVLGWLLHTGFQGVSAFVGAGLVFSGVTNFCGMGMLLARMPWNRNLAKSSSQQCSNG